MKKILNLLLTLSTSMSLHAQSTDHYLYFEPFAGGADISLDSIYPGGIWQVGAPDKPAFNIAPSPPNALVTDTAAPYAIDTTAYAEFHVPVFFFGEWITVEYNHRMDADSGAAYGWIEYFEPYLGEWKIVKDDDPLPQGFITASCPQAMPTDSGWIYTGGDATMQFDSVTFWCIGVLQGDLYRAGGNDTLRLRFAFKGMANTTGRDGWMIDNVLIKNYGCGGGIGENITGVLEVSPNPADQVIFVTANVPIGEEASVEIFRSDGASIYGYKTQYLGSFQLDLRQYLSGPYMLRITTDDAQISQRIIIQHW